MFGKKKKKAKAKANEQAVAQATTKPKIIPGGSFLSNVMACLADSRQTILTILILVVLIVLLLWLDSVLPVSWQKKDTTSRPKTETTQKEDDTASAPSEEAAPEPYIPPADINNNSDWENVTVDTSPDFSWGDESSGDADFWDDMEPTGEGATVSLPGGGQAPAGDFIFPHSSDTLLSNTELDAAFADNASMRSQRAINEIYARYGYNFHPEKGATAQDAHDYFHSLDWYNAICEGNTAANTSDVPVNEVENANIQKIVAWQSNHGLR